MRRRAADLTLAILLIATVGALMAGCSARAAGADPGAVGLPPPSHLPQASGGQFYLGVYEPGESRSLQPVRQFASEVGRRPQIVLNYTSWLEPFNVSFARSAHGYGALPLIQMDPTDVSLAQIATGAYDGYLRSYASAVRSYGHPVMLGFGHEMNGYWYSWGLGHTPAETFIAAWRHVVTVFREAGASDVIWLWTVDRVGNKIGAVKEWWPGSSFVNAVGVDGYYFTRTDSFSDRYGATLAQIRRLTDKPVLLSEIAVGLHPGRASQIHALVSSTAKDHLLGLVWFDIDESNNRDWRLEGDSSAIAAFRASLAAVAPRPPPTSARLCRAAAVFKHAMLSC